MEWNLFDFVFVVGFVNVVESGFIFIFSVIEVEGEYGFVEEILVYYLVEGRDDFVDGDGVVI